MNYGNLILIVIVLVIIYLIYNHFSMINDIRDTREKFTLEQDLLTTDNKIISNLTNLDTEFNNIQTVTSDNILYDLHDINLLSNAIINSGVTSTYIDSTQPLITNMKNDLTNLQNQLYQIKSPEPIYKSIKSLQNGMNLNVALAKDDKYIVQLNKGCLKAHSTGKYEVVECDNTDLGQQFTVKQIYSDTYYNSILEAGLDNSSVSPKDNMNYPFTILKSNGNGNCLQNNYGQLSIEPCQVRKSQRWNGLDNPNICN